MTSPTKTMRRIWFEMESPKEWEPNAAKLALTDSVIALIEKTFAQSALAAALPGGGASAERKLPEGSVEFFNVLEWVDTRVRKPGSLSRGAHRVRREPWQGQIQNPLLLVSPNGVAVRAWSPEHRTLLVSKRMSVTDFRAKVRDTLAREMAASIEEAMPGDGEDPKPAASKGISPL